ncbi:ATP-binding cassette domain-containing protein [Mesoplasma seiffertii]|uniref:ATP-binding cassette domain-containing protein n=1 Tax=Mesoplasma seiffertii TaxID=28224 RepID=UPI000685DD89|nr:ABC transporter ATP-binding protein [Mesoplasma seiffertii]
MAKKQILSSQQSESMTTDIVKFDNYLKRFTYKEQIGPLNFTIRKNKVTIIIGRSGSGKSVILNSIMGSYARYKGTIDIAGYRRKSRNGYKVNNEIGFYTQMDFINYDITLRTYLNQIAKVMGLTKEFSEFQIQQLLDLFQLNEHSEKKLKDFSWGMKNRLNLIISLLKDPNLIILDEPGANLDSLWRKKIKEILLEYKNNDKTVIIVVHNIDEVFDIVDDIILIEQGQIIYKSELKDLKLYLRSRLFFKTDIAKHPSYNEFKKQLLESGFEIFEEDLESKTLEIGVLKEEAHKINFLVAMIIKFNMFLEEIINVPMNFESIYNSLVFSENLKELEFYVKRISPISRVRLRSLLRTSKHKIKNQIKNSSSAEFVEEKRRLLLENKMLIKNLMRKKYDSKNVNILNNILEKHFHNSKPLNTTEMDLLKNTLKEMLSQNLLCKYEAKIIKLGLEVALRQTKNEKAFSAFESLLKMNSGNPKNLKVTHVSKNLIKNNPIIQDHKNQLFW